MRNECDLELVLCALDELRGKVKAAIGHKPALLDVEAAAQYLGLSPAYMNKLRRGGNGPLYIKVGDSVRYHIDDLNAWLAGRERRGGRIS